MYPRVKLKTAVGRPAMTSNTGTSSTIASTSGTAVLGDECMSSAQPLTVTRPVVNGIVQRWDDMELLWRELFEQRLKARRRCHPPF
jgi:actin-related protein